MANQVEKNPDKIICNAPLYAPSKSEFAPIQITATRYTRRKPHMTPFVIVPSKGPK